MVIKNGLSLISRTKVMRWDTFSFKVYFIFNRIEPKKETFLALFCYFFICWAPFHCFQMCVSIYNFDFYAYHTSLQLSVSLHPRSQMTIAHTELFPASHTLLYSFDTLFIHWMLSRPQIHFFSYWEIHMTLSGFFPQSTIK